MEVARFVLLLPIFFPHLLSTYTDLLHLLSLNQSFSCFLQLVSSFSLLVGPIYVFHSLYVPLLASKHLSQVFSKHDDTWPFDSIHAIIFYVFLLSTNFTPHIALTINLPALLKIATSFSFKQHISLPHNIADLT